MELSGILLAFLVTVPSAVTGFCFWMLEKRIERRQKQEDEQQAAIRAEAERREEARRENELYTIKGISAALALAEATARAVQRIPDAHCNGDMDAALNYAAQVKHDQREFLYSEGLASVYSSERRGA